MLKLNLHKFVATLAIIIGGTGPVLAQSLFDQVISVDRAAITKYEINQRILFMEIFKSLESDKQNAKESLIEDRLKMAAARRASIMLSEQDLIESMSNFAANFNRSLNKMLEDLTVKGVDEQTFRDYVETRTNWRKVVTRRFASRSNPTESEIDRAMASTGTRGGIRVLLTEIVLPASPDQLINAQQTAKRLTRIKSPKQFSEQARLLSVSQSRENGGKLEWINLNDLPKGLRPIISGLLPGQITKPLKVENAIVLFQLRNVAETASIAPAVSAIEYAQLLGPVSALVTANNKVDTCDDLYSLAKADPLLELSVQSQLPDQINPKIALRLISLDKNETNILIVPETDQTDMVMLCARVYTALEDVSRNQVASNLRSARLTSFADNYLAELRSNAKITYH
jgi:peptidyl-prolyl cis-trans isomerase SurA